ncbi:hypothetical protein ACXZ7F_22510 [Vibrio harveyi]
MKNNIEHYLLYEERVDLLIRFMEINLDIIRTDLSKIKNEKKLRELLILSKNTIEKMSIELSGISTEKQAYLSELKSQYLVLFSLYEK